MQNLFALLFTVYAVALVVVYVAWTRSSRPSREPRHTRRRRQGDCPHADGPGDGPCALCGIFGG